MPNKIKRGPSNVAYFKNYSAQDKREKNKTKKIEKHSAKHPNDKQSIERKVPNYGVEWGGRKKRE